MKLILREFLASLREREELDAILPDVLSELGFTVYSRPHRGTTQQGVDVAAISPGSDAERKVYLFSIKKGDLTRQEWDGTPQGLRSSLGEILDAYIPARIPDEHKDLPIVICITLGGDVQEHVRPLITGFTKANASDKVSFEEWNGDRIANLLLQGILREDLLPKPQRSDFQKAVALLDEPEVSYRHFARLARRLVETGEADEKSRVRAARQLYVCLWVLYVWAREVGNVEAPYRASELTILCVWELLKPLIDKDTAQHRALARVLDQVIKVHITIAAEFLEVEIGPHCASRDAVGMAVASRTSVDVNLKLFDILGRIGLTGAWLQWLGEKGNGNTEVTANALARYFDFGMSLIECNGTLDLPVSDDQALDIVLFLMMCLWFPADGQRIVRWLSVMVDRYDFTVRYQGKYPTSLTEYTDLVQHPREDSPEYFEEATAGSTLIPILSAWTAGLGQPQLATRLAQLVKDKLAHCTMQVWTAGPDTEEHLYINSAIHGLAITDLPIRDSAADLTETIIDGCKIDDAFNSLSAIKTGAWPIVLTACRHWRLPIPPDFYVNALVETSDEQNGVKTTNDVP